MSRLLAMVECRVAPSDRQHYLASLDARTKAAAAFGAHFWVFEHDAESGRFVEFTEAGSASAIRAASGSTPPADLWREVKGA